MICRLVGASPQEPVILMLLLMSPLIQAGFSWTQGMSQALLILDFRLFIIFFRCGCISLFH